MRLENNDYITIKKRMIEMDLTNYEVSLAIGYKSKKTFTDLLRLAKQGRGFIAQDKLTALEKLLSLNLR